MGYERRLEKKMIFFITVLRALAACLITNAHYTGIYPIEIIANGGLIGDVLFFAVSGYCLYNVKYELSPKGVCPVVWEKTLEGIPSCYPHDFDLYVGRILFTERAKRLLVVCLPYILPFCSIDYYTLHSVFLYHESRSNEEPSYNGYATCRSGGIRSIYLLVRQNIISYRHSQRTIYSFLIF